MEETKKPKNDDSSDFKEGSKKRKEVKKTFGHLRKMDVHRLQPGYWKRKWRISL